MAPQSRFPTTFPRLRDCDFEPRLTVDDCDADFKSIHFLSLSFPVPPFVYQIFTFSPLFLWKEPLIIVFEKWCMQLRAKSADSQALAPYLIFRDSRAAQWQRHGFCYNFVMKIEKHSIPMYRGNGLYCVVCTSTGDILRYLSTGGIAARAAPPAVKDKGQ